MTDHKPSDELMSPPQPQLCAGGCGFFGYVVFLCAHLARHATDSTYRRRTLYTHTSHNSPHPLSLSLFFFLGHARDLGRKKGRKNLGLTCFFFFIFSPLLPSLLFQEFCHREHVLVCYKQHANSAKQSSAEAQSPAAPKVETVTAAQVAVPSPSQPKPAAEAVAAPPAMVAVAESTTSAAAAAAAPDEATGMDTDEAGAGAGVGACAPVEQANPNRCFSCNKRVGFTGFKCRCEYTFCSTHRHSNKHNGTFAYKAVGRDAVAKANPAVIKDKVDSRI